MNDSPIRSHRDLKVWQLGMEIAEETYALTHSYPDDERFGLVAQVRRAAVSVPANIAEGNGRESTKEYLRFLSIAVGSLAEVETFLELSHRLQMADESRLNRLMNLVAEERRMLRGLQRSLRARLAED
ncbi:MAG: four helix bundle protein [Planctomycetaceae bacterium]|nr:four helix bundle protein [Planctomycetaceae bacterium]